MNGYDALGWYLEANGLAEADLEPGERDKILRAESLFEDDRDGGFVLDPRDTALVVVDMQNFFVHPDSPARCYMATRQLPRIARLCDEFRAMGAPVIFTQTTQDPDVLGGFKGRPGRPPGGILHRGSWGAALCEELGVRPDERVIDAKHTYDSFEGTDLDYTLRSQGVRKVVICGTNTDRCCETTARRAFALQYRVMFGSDVNSTDSALQHWATLRTIRYGIGRVARADEIVAELQASTVPIKA